MPGSFNRSVNTFRIAYLAPPSRKISLAWRWWRSEIAAMLPENLRQVVMTVKQGLVISAEHDEFIVNYGSEGKLQEIGRISATTDGMSVFSIPGDVQRCKLLLPADHVLTRPLTLPLAAEENLREVLSFELDRQTPFTAGQVYCDFVITGRSTANKTLSLQLVVTPRDIVDEALARLATAGIEPDVITATGMDNVLEESINLLPEGKRSNRNTILHRVNASLATLAFLLVATAIALPLIQKDRMISSLEADVRTATVAAQTTSQLRQEVETLVGGSQYLINKKQTEPTVVYLLDEMTGIIPDTTWVNRIDISDDEIQLQGQSAAAAELIALIEASPTFGNARFRSPVTQIVRTDQERFHLSAKILPGQDK